MLAIENTAKGLYHVLHGISHPWSAPPDELHIRERCALDEGTIQEVIVTPTPRWRGMPRDVPARLIADGVRGTRWRWAPRGET